MELWWLEWKQGRLEYPWKCYSGHLLFHYRQVWRFRAQMARGNAFCIFCISRRCRTT